MADKSQRNQFKKKVTTCPLLLSLFLLGAAKAETDVYFNSNYQIPSSASSALKDTASALGYYVVQDVASFTGAKTAENCKTDCETAITTARIVDGADNTKATNVVNAICFYHQDLKLEDYTIKNAALGDCKLGMAKKASASTTAIPQIDARIPKAQSYTVAPGYQRTYHAWQYTAGSAGSSNTMTNTAATALTACAKYDFQSIIGVPFIKEEKSDAASPVTLVKAQTATGLYAAIGQKSTPQEVYGTSDKREKHPAQTASGIFQYMEDYIGKPFERQELKACITAGCSGNTLQGQEASGLYKYIGYDKMAAIGTDANALGHKPAVEGKGLALAIGAPAVPKVYHVATAGQAAVVNDASGLAATGLYARIGEPITPAVIAAANGVAVTNDKAEIPASGLFKSIGTPSVVGTTLFSAIGAPVIPGEPVGATQASGGSSAKKDEVKSTGLYKHIGDAAAAASAYVPASAAGVTPVVAQANAKNAVVASGLYKSIADKAVTSCPTEAQIKEVIKTTEPKAPADGAEARFAATLLASAAALAALV